MPVAHLVWPSAFEVIGPFAFLLIAGTLLLEVPVLKGALGLRWDEAFGSVFLAHALALLGFVVVAIPFAPLMVEAATSFDVSGDAWWAPWLARARWIAFTLPGLLIPSGREALAWTGSSGTAQAIAMGVSVLVQLLVVRSVCDLRWTLRNVGTIVGLAAITAGAVVLLVRWPRGGEEEPGAAEVPVEG